MKRKGIIISIIYLGFLFVLSFNQITHLISDVGYNENKNKLEFPKIYFKNLDQFPQQFESYLSENFSFRGYFLKLIGKFNYYILDKSPKVDRLILGQNDWMYSINRELPQYLGEANFSEGELKHLLNVFSERERILDSMGIKMYIVINPTKYNVYPEFLPNNVKGNINDNSTSRFINYFKKQSSIKVIYTGNELIENKNKHQLFFKGDNHWNDIGGYYASKAIIDGLRIDFPNLPYYKLNDYNIDTVGYVGNLANMTGFGQDFQENKYTVTLKANDAKHFKGKRYPVTEGFPYPWSYQKHYTTNNSELPNVLIIRDSFGNAMLPFLRNSFNCSLFIFDSWEYGLNKEIVEQEKPDIVVFMILESFLSSKKIHEQ